MKRAEACTDLKRPTTLAVLDSVTCPIPIMWSSSSSRLANNVSQRTHSQSQRHQRESLHQIGFRTLRSLGLAAETSPHSQNMSEW